MSNLSKTEDTLTIYLEDIFKKQPSEFYTMMIEKSFLQDLLTIKLNDNSLQIPTDAEIREIQIDFLDLWNKEADIEEVFTYLNQYILKKSQ